MDSTVSVSNQIRFRGPHRHQNWSFPESILHYITKNPSSAKGYQMLILSCKCFYAKNPITFCKELIYYGEHDALIIQKNRSFNKTINAENIFFKLWITRLFDIENYKVLEKRNLASRIIPHIFRCDVQYLYLHAQDISFKDYLFLSKNARHINLRWCNVRNEDDSVVLIEKIVEHSPKALTFDWTFGDSNPLTISSKSAKNLLKIPHFKNLNAFSLYFIPDTFDIKTFCNYIKKNQNTRITLWFPTTISEDFKTRLETIVDKILEASENSDFLIPFIHFPGINREKFGKLRALQLQQK